MQKLRIIKQDKKSETFVAPKLAISPYFIGLCRIETLVHPFTFSPCDKWETHFRLF